MTDPVLEHDLKLADIVQRLVNALDPERIYLFGSRARGESASDCDYDVLVVVPCSELPAHRRDQQAYRALKGVGVAKDVLVWTREEFDSRSSVACSLPATVLREGRLLYAT